MSVKAPGGTDPRKQRIAWFAAALLCAIVLVAMWKIAFRMKEAKLAARGGDIEKIQAPADRTQRLLLKRNDRIRVEDFTLHYAEDLSIHDGKGRYCVDFLNLAKGEIRRWQELQLTFLEVAPGLLTMDVEIVPGAACFGSGRYRALRPGLRVEFPEKRAFTILAWDPARPAMKAKLEHRDASEEVAIGDQDAGRHFDVRYGLGKSKDGAYALTLDTR